MPAKKQHSEDPSAITEFPKFFVLDIGGLVLLWMLDVGISRAALFSPSFARISPS